MKSVIMKTPIGNLYLESDGFGVTQIRLANNKDVFTKETDDILNKAKTQLDEYFSGIRKEFDLQLHLNGTEFRQKVWGELKNIPYGNTISYLELSKRLSMVKAIRAVASANGKNPILIVIPCHRVIEKSGGIGGFSAGLQIKKWLLEYELNSKQMALF